MSNVYLLRKKLNERALAELNRLTSTSIEIAPEEATYSRKAPVYLEEIPKSVTMIGQRLSDAGLVYNVAQYQRRSTFLEVRYKDKHHYQKVKHLLREVDLSSIMEVVV